MATNSYAVAIQCFIGNKHILMNSRNVSKEYPNIYVKKKTCFKKYCLLDFI